VQRLVPLAAHAFLLGAWLWMAPMLVLGVPPWVLSRGNVAVLGLVAMLYVSALALASAALRVRAWPPLLTSIAISGTILAVAGIAAMLYPSTRFSQPLMAVAALALPIGLVGRHVVRWLGRGGVGRTAVAGAAIVLLAAGASRYLAREPAMAHRERPVSANQQFLRIATFPAVLPAREALRASGGAVTREPGGEGYLLVTATGEMHRVAWGEQGKPQLAPVGVRVPINFAEFAADTDAKVPKAYFRVADLVARREPDGATRVFASHHYWDRAESCFVVRVSTRTLPRDGSAAATDAGWKTLFETKPCLKIFESRGVSFAGLQVGGNLELLDERTLLLTVGDHQFDGWYRQPNLVRDGQAHYGKTVAIDLQSGRSSFFTVGHRNPQGLAVAPDGRIWSTEHGPQGGDELNLLRRGGDYGYPEHSYGTEYGSVVWPPSEGRAREGTIRPVYAWIPSIGISDLVVVSDAAFPRWQGDLLIASLRGKALWRVRIEEGRAVYAEPIEIGERIRDIAAGPGEFVLWTDSGAIVRVRPDTSVSDGSVLFARYCGGCHDDNDHRIGPNLKGVLSRSVASATGYSYSGALRDMRGMWDHERLDRFIAAPSKLVPGTTMTFDGVSDEDIRRQIIRYIEGFY
jgi:cytochrome c2